MPNGDAIYIPTGEDIYTATPTGRTPELERRLQDIADLWNMKLRGIDSLKGIQFYSSDINDRNDKVNALLEAMEIERKGVINGEPAGFHQDDIDEKLKDLRRHDRQYHFDDLNLKEDEIYYMPDVREIQKQLLEKGIVKEYTKKTTDDALHLVRDVGFQIEIASNVLGYDISRADAINNALNYLFYDYEIVGNELVRKQDVDIKKGPIEPGEISTFQTINMMSERLEAAPEYMTASDIVHLMVEVGVESGFYPEEMQVAFNRYADGDIDWNMDIPQMNMILEKLGIVPDPGNQKDQLDLAFSGAITSLNSAVRHVVIPGISPHVQLEAALPSFFAQTQEFRGYSVLESLDPVGMDIISSQEEYKRFVHSDWDINKDIEDNISAILRSEKFKDQWGFNISPDDPDYLDLIRSQLPGFSLTDKQLKRIIRYHEGRLIAKIEQSAEGKVYLASLDDGTATPMEAVGVWKLFKEDIGLDVPLASQSSERSDISDKEPAIGHTESIVQGVLQSESTDFRIATKDDPQKLAKDYLNRHMGRVATSGAGPPITGVGEDPVAEEITRFVPGVFGVDGLGITDEAISYVMGVLGQYTSIEEMVDDDNLWREVTRITIEAKQRQADLKFQEVDTSTIPGRTEAVKKALNQLVLDDDISAADYRSILKLQGTPAFDALLRVVRGQDKARGIVSDPGFLPAVQGALIQSREVTTADERNTLNKNIGSYIFTELQNRGIISRDDTPEYATHIATKVIPAIRDRTAIFGGVNSMADLNSFIDEAVGVRADGQPIDSGEAWMPSWWVNRDEFASQTGGPPPIPGVAGIGDRKGLPQRFQPDPIPDPVFDISSLRPELEEMAFNRPEFASFLQSRMQDPSYMESFQKEGKATVDEDAIRRITSDILSKGFEKEGDPSLSLQMARQRAAAARTAVEGGEAALEAAVDEQPIIFEEGGLGGIGAGDTTEITAARSRLAGFQSTYEERQKELESLRPYGTAEFEEHLYKMKTTPGMTSEEYYRSRLPGFEEEYKGSVFYKQEQERLKKERERTEATAEAQRRARLRRGGGGGRAMAVFRQARV